MIKTRDQFTSCACFSRILCRKDLSFSSWQSLLPESFAFCMWISINLAESIFKLSFLSSEELIDLYHNIWNHEGFKKRAAFFSQLTQSSILSESILLWTFLGICTSSELLHAHSQIWTNGLLHQILSVSPNLFSIKVRKVKCLNCIWISNLVPQCI